MRRHDVAPGRRLPAPWPISLWTNHKPGNAPRLLFSAMDASVATEIERAFAQAGHVVVSNSRTTAWNPTFRCWCPNQPRSLEDGARQQRARGWKGQIATNPNCSTVVLTMGARPVQAVRHPQLSRLPCWPSPALGIRGLRRWILGNVIPFIGNEEEKMQQEPRNYGRIPRRTWSRWPPR